MSYVLFCLLLCFSAFFSSSETALFSIDKVARTRLQQSKGRIEQRLSRLLQAPGDLLITVLLGNELTNIALSIVSSLIIAGIFSDLDIGQQALISVAVVVPSLMIFGEVTPKNIAARKAERVARFLSRPLAGFFTAVTPIRWFLKRITHALVRALGGDPELHAANTFDERELRTLVDVGTEAGVVETQERKLIHNVLDFGDRVVGEVMLPVDRVFSLSEKTPLNEAIKAVTQKGYSRIPIWRGHRRNIIGWVHAKELLALRWEVVPPRPLRALLRQPIYELAQNRADLLLDRFRQMRIHMAIVVDEFGKAVGLCTMEDLLEEVFGPITDEALERKGEDAVP